MSQPRVKSPPEGSAIPPHLRVKFDRSRTEACQVPVMCLTSCGMQDVTPPVHYGIPGLRKLVVYREQIVAEGGQRPQQVTQQASVAAVIDRKSTV